MEVKEYRIENFCRRIYRTNKNNCLISGIFIFLFGFSSFTQAQTNSPEEKDNYKIGVGDVLKIQVLKPTELSQDGIRVSNEGTIRMPMLDGVIPAACLTEAELSSEITKRYKRFILNPQIYVTVKEFNAYPVSIIGAVNAPKTFQLQRPTRLFQLLNQQVNGPSLNAGQSIQIFRDLSVKQCRQEVIADPINSATNTSPQQEIISLSLPELMNGNETANPFVQAGDIVRVTEAELKQAFVIGNVKSAVTVNLKEPITLSRAIAMAGGFAPGAQTDKIKISRQSSDKPIIVSMKDKKGETPDDILLQPNDIVDVPGPKRSLLKDIIKGIIPTVMRVPGL